MQQSNRELWSAFIAMIAISIMYSFVAITYREIPGASSLFGHGIGIIGFLLMLMTETLYTIRKRSRSAKWGRMTSWLQFHIFTGLVGPFMVLLHSSWKFNGLAGIVMLLTVVIVLSGFLGRYIYTSVPRNADGIEIEANEIEQNIHRIHKTLQNWLTTHPESYLGIQQRLTLHNSNKNTTLVFGRFVDDWIARLRWWKESRKLDPETRLQAQQLNELVKREHVLYRQLSSIALTRRLLSVWHLIHVPIGMVLFTAAFIHIIAAVYYSTLLH